MEVRPQKRFRTGVPTIKTKDMYKGYVQHLKEKNLATLKQRVFSRVLDTFGRKMAQAIVYDGYIFNMGADIGKLTPMVGNRLLKKNKNRELIYPIALNRTMRRKQEIIDEGGIPFEVIRDEKGKVIGNNGGQQYLIYHTSAYFAKIIWQKAKMPGQVVGRRKFVMKRHTLNFYQFNVCNMNKRMIGELSEKEILQKYVNYIH